MRTSGTNPDQLPSIARCTSTLASCPAKLFLRMREGLHTIHLPDQPLVPPRSDICFINNLPPELLCRIFEVGSADDSEVEMKKAEDQEGHEDGENAGETDSNETRSSTSNDLPHLWPPFPIVASHVCGHWRNVALSTPSLWARIVVTPDARPPYELKSMQLERSKSLPIDIHINCLSDQDKDAVPPSDADLRSLFSILIPHIHRWRTMVLEVSEYHHMSVFLNAVSDPCIPAAPRLATLILYHHDESDGIEEISMLKNVTLFGGMVPLLTRLVLWEVHVDWDQPWISSAVNLVDLELAFHPDRLRPSWAQFASILRGSVLKKLRLRGSGPAGEPREWFIEPRPGDSTDPNAPIQLLRVTNLTLAFHSHARAAGLLRRLHLPALKDLVLNFDKGDYTDFIRELARPAISLAPGHERSRSLLGRLESFRIAGLPCSARNIKMLYNELQNLTSLDLSLSWCLSRLFLDVLREPCTLTGQGDVWLPRLDALHVSRASGYTLCDVVRNRKDAGVPLSSLYVAKSCEVNDEDLDWLVENVETVMLVN